jgi:hypothetical protein
MTLTLGILGAVVACGCLFVLALCRMAADRDEPLRVDEPLYERRLKLVKKAQAEIAEQARWARER